jgi:hypothetical protein
MSPARGIMALRALKAHTFPETYGVYLMTKKPKTSPVQHQLPASVAVRMFARLIDGLTGPNPMEMLRNAYASHIKWCVP